MSEFILQAEREQQDAHGNIRTFTGKYVNPLAMRPEDICIEDIAHHLSNECRYAGACPYHYSVAYHSILVAAQFSTAEECLAGLLHDGAEAYLKDIPSPVKNDPRMKWYKDLEHELTLMIFDKFSVRRDLLEQVKQADNYAFDFEVKSFWGNGYSLHRKPVSVEAEFLYMFNVYRDQRIIEQIERGVIGDVP